jgi:hypothetical protein
MMERIELYLLGKASLEELEAGRKRELARLAAAAKNKKG